MISKSDEHFFFLDIDMINDIHFTDIVHCLHILINEANLQSFITQKLILDNSLRYEPQGGSKI